ncbi:MAG: thioredoxin domain-containing protein [Rhodospirillales bacterium]|jgi:uncharacterized protein YyaL (SSP411 family)
MPNALARETSPYLLQHADNPVDWRPWGEAAFAEARARNVPVLLSVGYAACHWCHVMAHESFEDEAIAAQMNALFVNIKVDREERPDLDTIYQSALAMLGQQGGWPLTMFLTPDAEPFWGGTYFPPASRWGRPGFPDVLRGVADTHAKEPDKVRRNVEALGEALGRLAENRAGTVVDEETVAQIGDRLLREVDPAWGGIGQAPKFPQMGIMELLWRRWLDTRREPFRAAVTHTLTQMCQGGIYDHLGGGFARYSVDDQWLVPHFEKMLYDNAALIDMLTLVWQETREPLYEQRVRETASWVLREMVATPHEGVGGGFASTLDADSEGVEGRFYVWSRAEIEALLGEDADLFCRTYDVTAHGNWEETNILNRREDTALRDPQIEARLAACRSVLLARRDTRIRPGWDDKVLADWNGLMIAALANAGSVFGMPGWVAAAVRAFDFVRDHMQTDGRLHHACRLGRLGPTGTLDDHADMARAALALFEATGEGRFLAAARGWVDVVDRHFWDGERGGYFLTADDAERLIVRTKTAYDSPTPSGNGTMLGVLGRLWHLTGEGRNADRAADLEAAFAGEVVRNFFPLASFLNAAAFVASAVQVVVVGGADDPAATALRRTVLDRSMPDRILVPVAPGADLPADHPAAGKGTVGGVPAAYVCRGQTCSPPVTDPAALAALLEPRAAEGRRA